MAKQKHYFDTKEFKQVFTELYENLNNAINSKKLEDGNIKLCIFVSHKYGKSGTIASYEKGFRTVAEYLGTIDLLKAKHLIEKFGLNPLL